MSDHDQLNQRFILFCLTTINKYKDYLYTKIIEKRKFIKFLLYNTCIPHFWDIHWIITCRNIRVIPLDQHPPCDQLLPPWPLRRGYRPPLPLSPSCPSEICWSLLSPCWEGASPSQIQRHLLVWEWGNNKTDTFTAKFQG